MWDFAFKGDFHGDSVWSIIIQLTLILVFLFLGNMIRRLIPFLKKSFIPSALIGGLLLGLANLFVKWVSGGNFTLVDSDIMKIVTYHALAIGFIAMTLKVSNKENKKGLGTLSIQNGLITGATYMIQAVFGILTVLVFMWAGKAIFYDAGIILPLGFGQGPGNAMTWDISFSKDGFMDTGGSFGLAIASIGFIVASVVGVIYLNIFRAKGEISRETTLVDRKVEEFVDVHEIEDNDSVDKFSIQVGIVAVCYAITFGIMYGLAQFGAFVSNIAWGFNFIFGVISATLIKLLLVKLKEKKVIKHKYINNYQMDRISGFAFDLMIIAGVAAIDINDIKNYIWVILALSIVGTIVTYIYVRFMTKHCYKDLPHEMFLVNFGTLTGTASNGMILLREVDPSFKTRSSDIFVVSQLPAMVAVAPLLLLLEFSAKTQTNMFIALGIFAFLAIAYTLIILFLSKKYKERDKK